VETSSRDTLSKFRAQSSALSCVRLSFKSLKGSRSDIIDHLSKPRHKNLATGYYSEWQWWKLRWNEGH